MTGDDELLLRTASTSEVSKVDVASDVVEAVEEVIKRDTADVARMARISFSQSDGEQSLDECKHAHNEGVEVFADMSSVTRAQLRAIFHPDRCTPVTRWEDGNEACMEMWLRAEAGDKDAAFLDFPYQPLAALKARADGKVPAWVQQLLRVPGSDAQQRRLGEMKADEEDDVVQLVVDDSSDEQLQTREELEAYEALNSERWRTVVSVPPPGLTEDKRGEWAAIQEDLFNWKWRKSLWEMKRDELMDGDALEDAGFLDWALLAGMETSVFVNHCFACNGTHIDAIGGGSYCLFGWKVFVSWDVAEWRAAVGMGRATALRHEIAPPVSAELLAGFSSTRWTLVGPGVTIILPSDRAHFVITLTSAALLSFVHTSMPHRIARCVVYALAEQMPTAGTWMDKSGQTMLTVAKMLWYLKEAMEGRSRWWPALHRRVAREEWMKIREELDGLMVISPHVHSLPGLRRESYPERYEASVKAIESWQELDQMMQSIMVD